MSNEFLPNLYTRDAAGATRFWRMEIGIYGTHYRSVSGHVGGAETATEWTGAVPKNVGRSNETTAVEQCRLEVAAEYKKKRDRKYYDDLDKVGAHKFFAPMLAHKYKGFPGRCYTQPKLDGIRMISSAGGLTSREGKPFYLPHITEALAPLFEYDPHLVLDGELYNHDLKDDFNSIVSLVKRQTRTPEQEAKCRDLVQYHVYDMPSYPGAFSVRKHLLLQLDFRGGIIRLVPTIHVGSVECMDAYYAQFLIDGYEGQMVRLDAPYEAGKRSKSLLKRKEFMDDEFPLVRIEEGKGNWQGYAKRAVVKLPDGQECGAGVKGSQEFTRQLIEDAGKYTHATVRYFGWTPDGSLRFPVAVDWHEGARSY